MSGSRDPISNTQTDEKAHTDFQKAFGNDPKTFAPLLAEIIMFYIYKIDTEVKRLAAAWGEGLVMPTLSLELEQIYQSQKDAYSKESPKKQVKAMEPVRIEAKRLATDANTRVSDFLALWTPTLDQRAKARYLIDEGARQKSGSRRKKPAPASLITMAENLKEAIIQLDEAKDIDCMAASASWTRAYGAEQEALDTYVEEDLQKPLAENARDVAALNPDGPDAKMLTLYSNLPDKMAKMRLTALAYGRSISPLSPAVAAAISIYTTSEYGPINDTLLGKPGVRSEAVELKCRGVAAIITTAMTKLAVWDEWPTTRGEKPWPGSTERYGQGNEFTIKNFWSTGAGFKFEGSLQISCYGKKGSNAKDVSAFSRFPNEKEVLFPPGTKFRVHSSKTQDDVTHIVVVEI